MRGTFSESTNARYQALPISDLLQASTAVTRKLKELSRRCKVVVTVGRNKLVENANLLEDSIVWFYERKIIYIE
jgi:hypothetical protein